MDHNDRVLITGATGFIGGRLVEMLASRGVRIRAATSNLRNCARVARLPVEIVQADLSDHGALARAAVGCNIVFHAAYRFGGDAKQQKVNLDGTRALAEAFLKHGGRRFVHVSSMSAYGDPHDEELTEATPQRPSAEPYSDTKLKIEQLLLELHRTRALPVTILQPAIVYGPYGGIWTTPLLDQVRSTRIALPAGGLGLCNAVYIDDVVSALMLAAERDSAIGETFLISGSSPTTWRDFYGAYEKMLDKQAVVILDDAQLQLEELRQRKGWILRGARRLLPDTVKTILKPYYRSLRRALADVSIDNRPLFLPTGQLRALYASKTHIRIDKAREKLGYSPAFDLERGMARTAEWARQANLLQPGP